MSIAKEKHPNLRVRLGAFLKIRYENNSFDVIVSTYAFHHLNEYEKSIGVQEMIRVLKKDGTIIIGDLMFESKEVKEEMLRTLSEEQVYVIKAKYHSYINLLKKELEKHNKVFEYERVDEFIYVIRVSKYLINRPIFSKTLVLLYLKDNNYKISKKGKKNLKKISGYIDIKVMIKGIKIEIGVKKQIKRIK